MSGKNTIFAVATGGGKSGVAIVRISGQQALAALSSLCDASPVPNVAAYTAFHTPANELIDRGLYLYFKAPRSFTGEDVVELHVHGSQGVLRELLDTLAGLDGLRPAEPGEFTRRAFLNGKMDLVEAEGLADLIDAETAQQKKQALRQMQGEMSRYFQTLRERIIHCLALLEAYIDFPDEEIPESVLVELQRDIATLQTTLAEALSDHKRGERLRDGIHAVIIGAPNAGKSSLMNALARRDVAIVSHRAGTTRDVIEAHMDIAGFPLILTDTAGIRESDDDIEQEGVRRALARAEDADIKLLVFDGEKLPDIDTTTRAQIDEHAIVIFNKSDLATSPKNPLPGSLAISTKTGEGIDLLVQTLEQYLTTFFASHTAPVITRARHRALLNECQRHLARFDPNAPLELACEELRLAAQAVGKITGKIQVDDVLDVVFSRFCIGK